jgi:hypothetical protein
MRGSTKVISYIFLRTHNTFVMKFTKTMSTYFTKLRLFFHKVSFIINTPFPPLREMPGGSHVQLFAEVSELFTHAVFQLDIIHKIASLEYILQETIKLEVGGC